MELYYQETSTLSKSDCVFSQTGHFSTAQSENVIIFNKQTVYLQSFAPYLQNI